MARAVAALVAVASENPPGNNYRAATTLLETYIRKCGFELEREFGLRQSPRVRRTSPRVFSRSMGGESGRFILMGIKM